MTFIRSVVKLQMHSLFTSQISDFANTENSSSPRNAKQQGTKLRHKVCQHPQDTLCPTSAGILTGKIFRLASI